MGREVQTVNYLKILEELEEELHACNYRYGGFVPAYYQQSIHEAIKAVKACANDIVEAEAEAERFYGERGRNNG